MFEMIVEYFIKVAMSNAIKRFKASIPKTKKQALRAKVQALGDRPSKRKIEPVSDDITQPSVFNCPVCNTSISENPDKFDEQSIGCDFCNNWYHYKCVSLTGKESCLKKRQQNGNVLIAVL